MWRPLAAARELGWAVLEKRDLARHSRVALPDMAMVEVRLRLRVRCRGGGGGS